MMPTRPHPYIQVSCFFFRIRSILVSADVSLCLTMKYYCRRWNNCDNVILNVFWFKVIYSCL